MTERPPNQPNVRSNSDLFEIHSSEGRLVPAEKRKKKNIPFSFLAQKIWPGSRVAALDPSQFRYRFSPFLVCESYLQKSADKPVSQMSFPSFIRSEKVFRVAESM